MELHQPEPEDRGKVLPQNALMGGVVYIARDIGCGQAQEIINTEMRFGIDLLVGHGFTAIAVEHTTRRLLVDMDHFGFRDISDGIALFLHGPAGPGQIFQPG